METTETTQLFLGATQLARRLGVSRRTAHYLIADHAVPVVRLRGRNRVPAGALETWIAAQDEEALLAVRREVGDGP